MRTLKFYGVSDDICEVEGTSGDEPDEIGCGDKSVTLEVKTGDGRGLLVVVSYDLPGRGCWMVGICPLDEEQPIPDWPMRWELEPDRQYSTLLTMEVPDTARVKELS